MTTATKQTIAPISKRDGAYWIDTSELHGEALTEYGPYASRAEADEKRGPVVARIRARRRLGIAHKTEPAFALSANELTLAVKLLAKMTHGSMRLGELTSDQRKAIGLLVYKWKHGTMIGCEKLGELSALKAILYREAGIEPDWPEAEHAFIQWAIKFVGTAK